MKARFDYVLALAFAALMVIAAAFMPVSAPPCNPLPMSPMIALELARSADDLHRIFGDSDAVCGVTLAAQLDHANIIDTFAYIPAYAGFFAFVAFALGRRHRLLGSIATVLVIVSAIADVCENIGMFNLSSLPENAQPWLTLLIVSTNIKWIDLAVTTTLCGLMVARRGGLWLAALPVCALPLAPSLWAAADPDAAGQYLLPGMIIASLCLLLIATWGAIKGDTAQSAA